MTIRVAMTWYGAYNNEGSEEHTQWFTMLQVPSEGDAVSVGDPYVPTLTVRRVTWVADLGPEGEGRRFGAKDSPPIDCEWHAEIWLSR